MIPLARRTTLTDSELSDAEAIMGHAFRDRELLRRALTHSSAGSPNNDMLATLGDFIHAVWLARRCFDIAKSKGELTEAINLFRSGTTQARILRRLGLDGYLVMGPAMGTNGGTVTENMAATMFEAILASIEIDGGRDAAEAFLDRVLTARVETPSAARKARCRPTPSSGGRARSRGCPAG